MSIRKNTVLAATAAILLSLAVGYAYGSWATSTLLEEASVNSQESLSSFELFFEIGKSSAEPFSSFKLTTILLEGTTTNAVGDLRFVLVSELARNRVRVVEYCASRASRYYRDICAQKLKMADEYISKYGNQVE